MSSVITGRNVVGDYYFRRIRGNRTRQDNWQRHQHVLNEQKKMRDMLHTAYWARAHKKDEVKKQLKEEAARLAREREATEAKMIRDYIEEESLIKEDTTTSNFVYAKEVKVSFATTLRCTIDG